MTESEFITTIERLRRQGRDDAFCEVKECTHDLSKDVWESISAFANTEGGVVILGVSEVNGFVPVDNFDIYKIQDQFISGIGDGGNEGRLTNPPQYSLSHLMLEGHEVLIIEIAELDPSGKPCYITNRGIQGGSYKRVDGSDIQLSPNEIYCLSNACVKTDADRNGVPDAIIDDLDKSIYEKTFNKANKITPRALQGASDVITKLQRLNYIDNKKRVTKAGLLSAGFYPQQFYPKLHIDVAVHAGFEKSSGGSERFLDRVICEGTIAEMMSEAIAAISRNLKRVSVVRGLGREDELEIPEEVFREAIANALIHRDYDERFDGEAVSVDIYENRVEIVNPGGLWGKSKANLLDGRSCCRNATLMRLTSLSELPEDIGSPAEGNGTGIQKMINDMLARKLKKPEFHPAIDHFRVILFRPDLLNKRLSKRDQGEAVVYELLLQYGDLSIRELEDMSALSVNQVRNRIRDMIDDGIVEATAPTTSRHRKYRIKRV